LIPGKRKDRAGWRGGLVLAALTSLASAGGAFAAAAERVHVPGATFATILPPADDVLQATVRAFDMDRKPVTNEQFARFVAQHSQWRRDRVARVFADTGYLLHWSSATAPAAGGRRQPATRVSWFAASAYCEARGARLPTWHEWELVGAAGTDVADARARPEWRQQILDWYARPASAPLPEVGRGPPNYYGVQDVHGLVWEWVLGLGSMMVSADNREQGDPDSLKLCGSGALGMQEKDNYAMLMRIATLSSMQASYTSSSMGFRCVTDAGARP
jgi:formylglycine-generating enzyme required for sulfatase activity